MWFSPLKGAHLTLGQLDKTLPVDIAATGNDTIERGSFVYIQAYDTTGSAKLTPPRFSLYTATEAAKPNAVPYIALMGVKDFQAGMAGNIGQVTEAKGAASAVPDTPLSEAEANFLGKHFTKDDQKFTGPRITAISVVQPAEYQTTAFDATKSYYVGQPLTIAAGKLTPFTGGQNIVGYVTAEPFTRWINDLGASEDGARISGGNAKVIEFSTAWIPVASTDTAGDSTGTAPGALNVGAPKVAAAEVKAPAAPAAPAPAAANKPQGAPAAGNNPQGK